MTKEKRLQYKKAYVELYEIIKNLSGDEKTKIPKEFVYNLKRDMDCNYLFQFDKSKAILEQNLMPETKALLVQLYAKFLAPKEEEELWKKYNQICLNKIEEKRREQYNSDNIFKKKNKISEIKEDSNIKVYDIVKYKEPIFKRILNKLKSIFHIK